MRMSLALCLLVSSTTLASSTADVAGKKQRMLRNLETATNSVEGTRECLKTAADVPGLKACYRQYLRGVKNVRADMEHLLEMK